MNYKTVTFYSFCLLSLAFVIACGAQNDSISVDTAFIQQLIDDPLTDQIKTSHKKQKDLILYNNLNMDALGEILKATPANNPCKVTHDLAHIRHAEEYYANMCRQIQLNQAINSKYPRIKDLSIEARAKIFYSSEKATSEDVYKILEARSNN